MAEISKKVLEVEAMEIVNNKPDRNEEPDWTSIRGEYIAGNGSYKKLAEKYGVSWDAVRKRGDRENWKSQNVSKCLKKSHELAYLI